MRWTDLHYEWHHNVYSIIILAAIAIVVGAWLISLLRHIPDFVHKILNKRGKHNDPGKNETV